MYTPEMAFEQWAAEIGTKGNDLVAAVNAGKQLYDKWTMETNGLTTAEILALPQFAGRTEADIVALGSALLALIEMHTALQGGALGASGRLYYLTPLL